MPGRIDPEWTRTPVTFTWGRAAAFVLLVTGSLYPPVLGIDPVLIGALLTVPLLAWEQARALPRILPVVPPLLALFTPLAVYAALVSPTTDYGHAKVTRLFTLTLLTAAAAGLIRGRLDLRAMAVAWTASGVGLALVTLTSGDELYGRAVGFGDEAGSNPIWLSRAMASALLCLIWLAMRRRRWLAAAPFALALLVAMFATGSRGPLLGVAVGGAVLMLSARGGRTGRVILLAMAGVAAVGAYLYLPQLHGLRALSAGAASVESSGQRELLWRRTLDVIHGHPGGVGFGNWAYEAGTAPTFMWPHNLFLEVFAEAGWLVGAILLLVVVRAVWRVLRKARDDRAAALVAALLVNETLAVCVSGDVNARPFFALVVLAAVVVRWPADEPEPLRSDAGSGQSRPDRVDGRLRAGRV